MDDHPVSFSVEYPERQLNRLTTAFRIFTVIPIAIVLGTIMGYQGGSYDAGDARRRLWRSAAPGCCSSRRC